MSWINSGRGTKITSSYLGEAGFSQVNNLLRKTRLNKIERGDIRIILSNFNKPNIKKICFSTLKTVIHGINENFVFKNMVFEIIL